MVDVLPIGVLVTGRSTVVYSNKMCLKTVPHVRETPTDSCLTSTQTLPHTPLLPPSVSKSLPTVSSQSPLLGLKSGLKHIVRQKKSSAESLHDLLFSTTMDRAEFHSEKFEIRSGHEEQHPLPLAVNTSEFRRGKDRYTICTLTDQSVYEELQAERLHATYQKSFFAMLTHELRNPLHGVLGVLESFLDSSKVPAELKHASRLAMSTGQLMMCLINDILDLSQIEANKFKLSACEFDPSETIQECTEIMQFQYEKKRVLLKSVVSKSVPRNIVNDKNRYKQVVLNLLGNALKFTSKGYVEVKVDYDPTQLQLVTKVKDTGAGICPEDQAKLFSMYGKLEAHSKQNPFGNPCRSQTGVGAGLGLAICKRLTEVMGGAIELKSVANRGSTFKFVIENKVQLIAKKAASGRRSSLLSSGKRPSMDEDEIADENLPDISIRETRCLVPLYGSRVKNGSTGPSLSKVLIVDDDYTCAYVMQSYFRVFNVETDIVRFIPFYHFPNRR